MLPNQQSIYSSDELDAHRYVIETRNKYIAHSVNAFEEAAAFVIISGSSAETLVASGVGAQHTSLRSLRRDRALKIAAMCETQIVHLNARVRDAEDRLIAELRGWSPDLILNLPTLTEVSIDQSAVSRSRPGT